MIRYYSQKKEVYVLTAYNDIGCKSEEYYAESLEDAARLKEYLLSSGGEYITRVEVSEKKEMREWRYVVEE